MLNMLLFFAVTVHSFAETCTAPRRRYYSDCGSIFEMAPSCHPGALDLGTRWCSLGLGLGQQRHCQRDEQSWQCMAGAKCLECPLDDENCSDNCDNSALSRTVIIPQRVITLPQGQPAMETGSVALNDSCLMLTLEQASNAVHLFQQQGFVNSKPWWKESSGEGLVMWIGDAWRVYYEGLSGSKDCRGLAGSDVPESGVYDCGSSESGGSTVLDFECADQVQLEDLEAYYSSSSSSEGATATTKLSTTGMIVIFFLFLCGCFYSSIIETKAGKQNFNRLDSFRTDIEDQGQLDLKESAMDDKNGFPEHEKVVSPLSEHFTWKAASPKSLSQHMLCRSPSEDFEDCEESSTLWHNSQVFQNFTKFGTDDDNTDGIHANVANPTPTTPQPDSSLLELLADSPPFDKPGTAWREVLDIIRIEDVIDSEGESEYLSERESWSSLADYPSPACVPDATQSMFVRAWESTKSPRSDDEEAVQHVQCTRKESVV